MGFKNQHHNIFWSIILQCSSWFIPLWIWSVCFRRIPRAINSQQVTAGKTHALKISALQTRKTLNNPFHPFLPQGKFFSRWQTNQNNFLLLLQHCLPKSYLQNVLEAFVVNGKWCSRDSKLGSYHQDSKHLKWTNEAATLKGNQTPS